MRSAKARRNKHNLSNLCCGAEFSFPFICLHKLSFYVGVCCVKLGLCSYLRHSLIGFNKKCDAQLAEQEVEAGTSCEGERNSGKKEEEPFHQETDVVTDWMWLGGWVPLDELVESLPS